jgi:3-phenylpropionate/trans-cinnamate dioxygenase ferredoxin component
MAAIVLGATADVPAGAGKTFMVENHPIAVFQVEGRFYALDDTCSHADASLGVGEVDSDELCVECPLHGSLFDLATGTPRTLPAFAPVKTYKVWVEHDQLFVEYPD